MSSMQFAYYEKQGRTAKADLVWICKIFNLLSFLLLEESTEDGKKEISNSMIPTKELQQMRAFHKNAKLKKDIVSEILNHQKQDQIIKGTYGQENGKWRGCAVGCSIHSLNIKCGKNIPTNDHTAYEKELGIPESLAKLEDYLFENMPQEAAVKWPAEFMKAIPVGANLSLVAPRFIVGTLREVIKLKYVKDDKAVVKAVVVVAKLWEQVIAGKNVKEAAWSAAWLAAWSAAESAAESAARSAAWLAAWSAAESAAWSAAESAAESAAWSAAWSAASYKMSRRLLKIIRSCK